GRRRRCFLSTAATSQPTAAAEALGPELGLLAGVEGVGFGRAVAELGAALWARPWAFFEPELRRADGPGRDRRFDDPAWTNHPGFAALKQSYLAGSQYLRELVDAAGLDEATTEKAACVVN